MSATCNSVLERLRKRPQVEFPEFIDHGKPSNDVSYYFVYHDIDTPSCLENLYLLLEVDEKLQIPTAYHFRADSLDYDLSAHIDIMVELDRRGFEVGLHNSCYRLDNYFAEFERETSLISDCLGRQPASFSLYGFGLEHIINRRMFRLRVAWRMKSFGYTFSDSLFWDRRYDHVLGDCAFHEGKRVIFADWENPPIAAGRSFLILTHPCYWLA